MAIDAFFPKITLPKGKTDIRKGEGLGIKYTSENGKVIVMVVDAFEGGEPTRGLIDWLKSIDVKQIDLAVATHAHGDHFGGFYDIAEAGIKIKDFRCYHIDSIREGNSESRKDSDNLLKLIRWLQARGTRVLFVDHGDVLEFGDISWHIYRKQPKGPAAKDDPNAWSYVNDGSLVLCSPELSGIIFGDGPAAQKEAIAYFQKKFGKTKFLIWVTVSHHGGHFSMSNAQSARNAGCEFAYESCVERRGPGKEEWTEFGARRLIQNGVTVWMQDENIYIHAAAGKITFKQGSKTLTYDIPYQGKESKVTGKWEYGTKGWWYKYSNGGYATGWALIDKKWYYFDADGWMLTGWRELQWSQSKKKNKKDWFFFDQKTGVMLTGWQVLLWSGGVSTFCFDENGVMLTGWHWLTKDGKTGWYYFENSGAMHTGWIFDDGAWYYLGPDGKMATGWVMYKGKRCYLEPLSDKTHIQGRCYVNCRATIDGKLYSFDSDGYATEVKTSGTVSTVAPGTRVIDVSEFQPDNIDWNKVKKSGHAVVLRMGLRGSIKGTPRYRKVGYDYHFKMYVEGVIKAGIPYSVYYFPTPLSDEEADQEADWIIMNVAGLNLSMPLWLDSERVNKGVANDISTATRTRYLKRITDKLVAAGIPCGIYASTSWLNNQINMGELPQQVRDNTWCAQYAASCTYGGVYAMWQYSSKARVDGINDEIDISVVNREFNMSCRKTAPKENALAKDNVKIFPTTNPVKISNSGSDEHGNYKGGAAGDQTSREWQIRDWYNRPWNCVLRHPDPAVRACLADLATKAANNNRIGYDQYQRQTYWNELQKVNYDPSKITVACEADCSAGVIANIKAAGYILNRPELQNISCTYTGNMRAGLQAAGFACLTDSKYLTSSAYLVAGDVLLNDKHHTATAVTNGIQSDGSTPKAATMPLIKKGSKGSAVLQLQKMLNAKGYKLTEDGDFGSKTEAAVKAYQKANGLEVDGEVGPMTWGVLFK